MKIRSIEISNFRKFVGTFKIDNIGDNVSVLVGPNELGKSTLLQAINGVIFEKARSTAGHVKAFRHFVNGTVPEVKLAFEVEGVRWMIHKRFGGQTGKAVLTDSGARIFEDDAAETELQRLLGFTGGSRGGEPGIWGTLWVQQGKSFGDMQLDENAQRTMQGCLETQVGVVTGGIRGQKIPRAVREALEELRSARGPRGKYKDAIERLAEFEAKALELEAKRTEILQYMEDLVRTKRDLMQTQSGWDDEKHRAELEGERAKRTTAVTRAAELTSIRNAAILARERATNAQKLVEDRARITSELQALEPQLEQRAATLAAAGAAQLEARSSVDSAERYLADLRVQTAQSAEKTRTLERTRAAVLLDTEIKQHQGTLDKAAVLENEALHLSEMIGAIAATDDVVIRIEAATTELSAAEAAMNAVATTVSLAIENAAQQRVLVDKKALKAPSTSLAVLEKTVIAIQDVGTITVEPQIKNRNALRTRQQGAIEELKAAFDAAGVRDLNSARLAAAKRKEHERRLSDIRKEITNLAPGNRAKKLQTGLQALRDHMGELRGRLTAEMKKLALAELPDEAALAKQIEENHGKGERLATDIASAEARLAGPQDVLAQADKKLRSAQDQVAVLKATIDTKKADLEAGRAISSDAQLTLSAESLLRDATEKETQVSEREKNESDSVEVIDARIKRLEGAATNYHRSVVSLGTEVTRLTTLIEANEGAGVEELLLTAEAERDRLASVVAEYEKEGAILELLLTTLDAAESEAKNLYLAPVVGRVEPYLRMLLPGANIVLDENLHIAGLQRDGQREEFDILSGGTQEQLAVLTRLAFAELLLGQGRPATVILDDALAFSDDDRIELMFDVLMRAGAQVQIIVLTCRKHLFTRLGAAPLEIKKLA
jgi:energy-coupling factor transporter ATP-binding protein EcfA2